MRNLVTGFLRSEDGAISVDWVVLTAAVVGLQIALLITPIREALTDVSESIGATVDSAAVYLE